MGARMRSRPGRKTKDSGRRMWPDPINAGAGVWIVITIVLFLLSFAAARWLPDLIIRSPHSLSKPTAASSTSSSEVTTTYLEQSDNIRSVSPKPVIPIVIRRSSSPDAEVSALPPQTEISSAQVSVPESVNTVAAPQQLDLREIENAKRVQRRLIDLGFLFGAADGIWGQGSRRALREFRAAHSIGEGDTWDEATEERLLRARDVKAANRPDVSFTGG